MLDAIHKKLEIEDETGTELQDLEKETRPEDVLAEIARLQHAAAETEAAPGGTGGGQPAPKVPPAPTPGTDGPETTARAASR